MDLTVLAVVVLLCGGIPLRNKIYKERKQKKDNNKKDQVRWWLWVVFYALLHWLCLLIGYL